MIYVIKNKINNVIWVGNENKIKSYPEEERDDYSLVLVFPWDLYGLLGYLRPWIIPGEKELYQPEALEALEEIKDLPEPPENELKRIYQVPEKLEKFKSGLYELISFGLLPSLDWPEIDISWVVYEDDFLSSLCRALPEKYFDLGLLYYELEKDQKEFIRELWKAKTRAYQESLMNKTSLQIPQEFLPGGIRSGEMVGVESEKILIPDFLNPDPIWKPEHPGEDKLKERLYYEFPIGSVWERSVVREKLDEIEKSMGLPEKIRATDLSKYFEIRTPNNQTIQIFVRK